MTNIFSYVCLKRTLVSLIFLLLGFISIKIKLLVMSYYNKRGTFMVRMKDVAKHAGVSVATVSNVITGKRVVSDEVQKVVMNSIHELNYNVNLVARGLKMQRTNTIGVILPDLTNMFFLDIMRGIINECNKHSYTTNLLSSNFNFETEKSLVNMAQGNRVDGIILDSCVNMDHSAKWAQELSSPVMPPIISLENQLDSNLISSVSIDTKYWSTCMTQHLIDIGRRKILFICGLLEIEHEYNRLLGYQSALASNNLPYNESYICSGAFSSYTGYICTLKALDSGIPFDAIQASNDHAAVGALKALLEKGIRVPEDIAVCGFDNLFPTSLVRPAVTTIDVPTIELGATAARVLLDRINSSEAPAKQYTLGASFIKRASTCPEISTSWDLDKW